MTLEELLDKTFVGKRVTCESFCGVVHTATLEFDYHEERIMLEVHTNEGGYLDLGRYTEFTLADVEDVQ